MSRIRFVVCLSAVAWALSCGGPPAPRTVAASQHDPKLIAIDLNNVYWTASQGHTTTLFRTQKEVDADKLTTMASINAPITSMVVDDDGVYLVVHNQNSDVVRKVPKDKGAPKDLASSRNPITSLAIDATHVYWTQGGNTADPDEMSTPGVLRTMRHGGTPLNVVTKQPGTPSNLAMNATHAVWVNAGAQSKHIIMAYRKGGGQDPVVLAEVPQSESDSPPAVAADDTYAYYRIRNALMRVAVAGGPSSKICSVTDSSVAPIAVDAKDVYFIVPSALMRVPNQGGSASVIAQGSGRTIAVDSRFVFWLTADSVMQIAKL